jgi:acetyl-CoA C-acetyltransferase
MTSIVIKKSMQSPNKRIQSIVNHLNVTRNDVYIVSYARTPLGSLCGALSSVEATTLGATAIAGAFEKLSNKLHKSDVDEVFMGHVLQGGCGQAPARQAALKAGIPNNVPCSSVNKVCASGMKALTSAATGVMLGINSICVVGGMENMTRVPHYISSMRCGKKLGHDQLIDGLILDGLWDVYNNQHMGNCAEKTSRDFAISRADVDAFACESARRAINASQSGTFDQEIVPVIVGEGTKAVKVVKDEQIEKLNPGKLPSLRPSFDPAGIITPGNASPISDGAAALIVMSGDAIKQRSIVPIAKIISWSDGERDPVDFGIAPSIAIQRALLLASLTTNDIDIWEINEAFASVVLANMKLLGDIPHDKVNVLGGAISLGHPLGCSGARIVCTLLTAMKLKGAKTGCAAICNGGGGSTAIIVEMM